MILLLLSLAGGLGALARFLTDTYVAARNPLSLPLGTLVVNTAGSLLLGLLTGWAATRDTWFAQDLVRVVGTGFCGGYTTFSTASVEAVRLWLAEGRVRGAAYAALTLLVCTGAAVVGLVAGGAL